MRTMFTSRRDKIMPTYDFLCRSCNERFEIFLTRIIRDDDKRCPKCGGSDIAPIYEEFSGFTSFGGSSSCGSGPSGFSFG